MLYILTLTWNKCDKLAKLKESLIPALKGIDYTWLIKDNDSKDNTYETVLEWKQNNDKINILKYKDNLQNFSEGMNYLFNVASPQDKDLVLLLNNDVVFNNKTSIKNMMEFMKQDDVGVVGTRLLYTGTNTLQHAGVIFTAHGLPANYRNGQPDDAVASKNRYFQAVTGAVMLTNAGIYKNICTTNRSGIGGLCEDLRWCFDDIDACLSILNRQNKKIVYCGETSIFHDESASLKTNPVNKLFFKYNVDYFINKWRGQYAVDYMSYFTDKQYNVIR